MSSAVYLEAPHKASEEEELALLVRALDLTEGFALIFAVAHPAQTSRLIETVKHALPEQRFITLDLSTPQSDLLSVLPAETKTSPPDGLFVTGLENWLQAENA